MNRGKRIIGKVSVLAALLLVGFLCWRIDQQYRQEQRNHALIVAIKAQNQPHVLRLLSEGADANVQDTGAPPSFLQMLRHLFVSVGKRSPPANTAQHPSALLLAGRWVEVYAPNGTYRGPHPPDETILLALLDHGANPNVEDRHQTSGFFSPLGYAIINRRDHRQDHILRRLLERGANPKAIVEGIRKPDGSIWEEIPLNLVIQYDPSPLEAFRLLVEYGADVNAADSDGETPLMKYAWGRSTDGVLWLLQHGAHIDAKDKEGKTALMYAAIFNDLDAVRLLLEYGASVSSKDNKGRTALDYANDQQYLDPPQIASFLRQYGAK